MPVTEQYSPKDYTGDGTNQVFSVPDLWFEQSDVYVLVDGVDTAWTREAGVGIRLAAAPADGVSVVIYRQTELTQDKDFATSGRMPANEVSEGFDRQILINQEVKDRSTLLPPDATTQNKINTTVGFDENGDPVLRTATQESTHLGITDSVNAAQVFANAAEEQAGFANDERVLAEAAATTAQAAQSLSSATLLDLSTRSFPKVRIAAEVLGTISSDVTLTFPGGGSITFKASARPYAEPNGINAEGNPSAVNYLSDIVDAVNGNAIDFDSGIEYGLNPSLTVSNYTPIPDWTAEFPVIGGALNTTHVDLTYYGAEEVTFTVPSPFVVIDGANLTPPANLPFSRVDTFASPTFTSDPSDAANATATTAAIQAVIDTRARVYLPDGRYKLNGTLHLTTQGQIIEGESPTRTILEWTTDVDGFEIDNSTESNTTNFPSSSVESSSWGAIRNLMIMGPVGSTKKGITNTEDPNGTLWIGEGWRYDFLTIYRWQTGIYSSSAARLNSRSINVKSCTKGVHLESGGSATNNCHVFYGMTLAVCDIGLDIAGVRSGWFQIQDTTGNRIDVNASSSMAHIEGGQAESYSERFLVADNSCRLTVSNVNCLASTTIIPISVNGASSVKIENCQNIQAGNTVEIAELLDAGSSVFGTSNLHLAGSVPGDSPTNRVKQSNGDSVFICPVPWRGGTSIFSADAKHRGALHWRGAVGANNLNNDDLEGIIEMNGNFVRANAFKQNTFSVNVTGQGYTLQGFEDVVLMDNTSARTVGLRATSSPYYRASANMRVFTIIDSGGNAAAGNITINPDGVDTINGAANYVINANYGSVKIGTTGDGKWFILP